MDLYQDDVIRILKLIHESPVGRVGRQIGDLTIEALRCGNLRVGMSRGVGAFAT